MTPKRKLKILITTGIFPPKIGGPAQYAKHLKKAFVRAGHSAKVRTFGLEDYLPTGVRHLYFLLKIIPAAIWSDTVFILDTFSVGLPTIFLCKILGKKGIIRTGGDFLWEQYVERTKKKVLLRNFYQSEISNFSRKEKIIFKLTKWTLRNASKIIFSTDWQRDIFVKAYGLKETDTCVVENYYGPKESDKDFDSKEFIGSGRNLVWKNFDILRNVFEKVRDKDKEATLFMEQLPYEQFMKKMSEAYAVILVSLGDISPNMILAAIRLNRPFVCTKEIGIYDRVKDAGIFVNPLDQDEIERAVLDLLTTEGYVRAKEKVRSFSFIHTWDEIAHEFLGVYDNLKA